MAYVEVSETSLQHGVSKPSVITSRSLKLSFGSRPLKILAISKSHVQEEGTAGERKRWTVDWRNPMSGVKLIWGGG